MASVPSPAAPESPTYAPGQPYPAAGQSYPPGAAVATKSKAKPLIIILIVAAVLLVLCCGGVGAAIFVARSETTDLPTTPVAIPTVNDEPSQEPTEDPTTTPTEGPTSPGPVGEQGETFNMEVGDAVIVTKGDDEWSVTVTSMSWKSESCGGISEPKGDILVAEIEFEVLKGEASINPLYFKWLGSDGQTQSTFSAMFSGCAEPLLDAENNVSAGTKLSGKVAFDITGNTTGVLSYDQILDGPTASWSAPAV